MAALVLAGCRSTPPPAPAGEAATVGDWTVTTSGRVRVEGGVVN